MVFNARPESYNQIKPNDNVKSIRYCQEFLWNDNIPYSRFVWIHKIHRAYQQVNTPFADYDIR